MRPDKTSLAAFVASRRRVPGQAEGDLSLLDPLVRKADSGMYSLDADERLRSDDAVEALSAAIGSSVARASFVSLTTGGRPLVGDALASFWEAHARGLAADVKGTLFRRNMTDLHERLGHADAHDLA